MLAAGAFVHRQMLGWAFGMTSVAIAFATITIFLALYPRVMISSLDPAWSLTIYNASSTPYTLKVMSIVALLFVPDRARVPGLDVLGVPPPDHGGDEAGVLTPRIKCRMQDAECGRGMQNVNPDADV
jgi:hypothetical protein